MNVKVNQDSCISCGFCVSSCPSVFGWGKDGKAEAFPDKANSAEEGALEGVVEYCPVGAIKIQ